MIAGLLFIGFALGLACALSKPERPPFPQDFSAAGYAAGYAGLACWTVAFGMIFVRIV